MTLHSFTSASLVQNYNKHKLKIRLAHRVKLNRVTHYKS